MGCGSNPVVEHWPAMLEALGSIQTQQKQNKQTKRNGKYESDKSVTEHSDAPEQFTGASNSRALSRGWGSPRVTAL